MNKHVRNGIITMICWVLFLTVVYGGYSLFQGASLAGLLDKETGGLISFSFFIGWALIWFGIGRHYSYDYAVKKELFCERYPSLDKSIVQKAFRYDYTSKMAKMLSRLFFVSVFVYVAANVRGEVTLRNVIYIGLLMVLSISTYLYYKAFRNYNVA